MYLCRPIYRDKKFSFLGFKKNKKLFLFLLVNSKISFRFAPANGNSKKNKGVLE